jgi:REP element-mobilizing transposase RayT
MARKPRIEVADGFYHVATRGNDRQPIYFANWSGKLFEGLLGQTAVRFDWQVLAYCLMTNHYHLVVRIRDAVCPPGSVSSTEASRRSRTECSQGRTICSASASGAS